MIEIKLNLLIMANSWSEPRIEGDVRTFNRHIRTYSDSKTYLSRYGIPSGFIIAN